MRSQRSRRLLYAQPRFGYPVVLQIPAWIAALAAKGLVGAPLCGTVFGWTNFDLREYTSMDARAVTLRFMQVAVLVPLGCTVFGCTNLAVPVYLRRVLYVDTVYLALSGNTVVAMVRNPLSVLF